MVRLLMTVVELEKVHEPRKFLIVARLFLVYAHLLAYTTVLN